LQRQRFPIFAFRLKQDAGALDERASQNRVARFGRIQALAAPLAGWPRGTQAGLAGRRRGREADSRSA